MVERPLLSRTRGLRLVHRMYNQVMPDCARGKKKKKKRKGHAAQRTAGISPRNGKYGLERTDEDRSIEEIENTIQREKKKRRERKEQSERRHDEINE